MRQELNLWKSVDDYVLIGKFDAIRGMPKQLMPKTPSAKDDECIVDGKDNECIVASKDNECIVASKEEEDEDSIGIVDDQVVVTGEGDVKQSLLKKLYDYCIGRPSQVQLKNKKGNAGGSDDRGSASK